MILLWVKLVSEGFAIEDETNKDYTSRPFFFFFFVGEKRIGRAERGEQVKGMIMHKSLFNKAYTILVQY